MTPSSGWSKGSPVRGAHTINFRERVASPPQNPTLRVLTPAQTTSPMTIGSPKQPEPDVGKYFLTAISMSIDLYPTVVPGNAESRSIVRRRQRGRSTFQARSPYTSLKRIHQGHAGICALVFRVKIGCGSARGTSTSYAGSSLYPLSQIPGIRNLFCT